jgi:hypothetical protein
MKNEVISLMSGCEVISLIQHHAFNFQEYVKLAKANSALHRQKMAEWKKRMIVQGHAEKLGLKPTRKVAKKKTSTKRQSSEAASAEAKETTVAPKVSGKSKATGSSASKDKSNAKSKDSGSSQNWE